MSEHEELEELAKAYSDAHENIIQALIDKNEVLAQLGKEE